MGKIFFLFGGSPENLRAKALLEKWRQEGMGGVFIVTGYPNDKAGELQSMVDYLLSNGVPENQIFIDSSYETFSNVESLEKYLINRKIELDECEIFASTGILHWIRFKLIFLWGFRYGKHFNFFEIKFIPSGEQEIWYAAISILPYILLTPKGFQIMTRFIRRKEYALCKNSDYLASIAEKFGVNLV